MRRSSPTAAASACAVRCCSTPACLHRCAAAAARMASCSACARRALAACSASSSPATRVPRLAQARAARQIVHRQRAAALLLQSRHQRGQARSHACGAVVQRPHAARAPRTSCASASASRARSSATSSAVAARRPAVLAPRRWQTRRLREHAALRPRHLTRRVNKRGPVPSQCKVPLVDHF